MTPGTICSACRKENPAEATVCLGCGHDLVDKASSPLHLGHVLAGRYEILSELGSGGMGVVYRAHDRALEETVAVKVIRAHASRDPNMARRFRDEIKLARRVGHPNVCRIFEYGEDQDVSFISMQYIDGTDLRALLRERGPFPLEEACDIGISIASALDAIHAMGVIHRDLKTVNLMRDKAGVVYLMDFGIAKAYAPAENVGVTAAGIVVGTPEYMSPEQASGARIDFRTDIYSFGIVLHELVTGDVPFRGETPLETVLKHIHEDLAFERTRIPTSIKTILKKTLEKRPDDRYGTAKELIAALRQARSALVGVNDASMLSVTEAMSEKVRGREAPFWLPLARLWSMARWPSLGAAIIAGAWILWSWTSRSPRVESAGVLPRKGIAAATPHVFPTMPELRVDDWTDRSSAPTFVPMPLRSPRRAELAPTAVPTAAQEVPSDVIARLDRLSAEDPDVAYEQAIRLSAEYAKNPRLEERLARYRKLCVARFLENGARALQQARITRSRQDLADALRLFDQALALEPTHAGARQARDEALRFMKEPGVLDEIVTFVQSETLFTPPIDVNNPPGFAPASNDSEIRSAQPPAPRAQLAIEVIPSRLRVGDEYKVRYFIFNRTASPVKIGAVTIKNNVGGRSVTGGSVEPLVQRVAPKTRALLLEAGGSWRNDPATRWATTLTVVLADGGSYAASLHSVR